MTTTTSITRLMRTAALVAAATAAVGAVSGCRGDRSNKPPRQFFPDLDDQQKVKPQTESTFFKDFVDEETGEEFGRSQREPVAGTVPFGRSMHTADVAGVDFADRNELLRDNPEWAEGKEFTLAGGVPQLDENGQPAFEWVVNMRDAGVEVTPEFLDLGQKKYNIFCLACHSEVGDGKGLVGIRWSYPLPNFNDDIYREGGAKGQDGYLFHILRHGVANPGGPYPLKMQGYGRKVSIEESWAIVAHIRALQATRTGTLDDLTEAERLNLERTRSTPAAPAEEVTQ